MKKRAKKWQKGDKNGLINQIKTKNNGNKRRNTGKEDFEAPPEREKDYPITGSDKI